MEKAPEFSGAFSFLSHTNENDQLKEVCFEKDEEKTERARQLLV
jgi:hypothetical protein